MTDTGKITALLAIRKLCKSFPSHGPWQKSVRVLDGVDMDVARGEIRGIVGESGSGKTTLARCSLRLLEPSSGSVFFDGQDLTALNPAALRSIRRDFQMIFQDVFASLNPGMTVKQTLLEPLEIHRIGSADDRSRRIHELLDSVSLSPSLLDCKPGELSGGQQQRVGIARGLALHPRLLVADEPVSALDPSVQAQILNLLADLKQRLDLTLILISHSLHAVHYLCSRVSVLYRGRLVEDSSAARFFKGPNHPYSRALLDALLVLDPNKQDGASPERGDTLFSKRPSGCVYYESCPRRMRQCAERVPPLLEIEPGEKTACFLFQ